jgi:hypothetical protein
LTNDLDLSGFLKDKISFPLLAREVKFGYLERDESMRKSRELSGVIHFSKW